MNNIFTVSEFVKGWFRFNTMEEYLKYLNGAKDLTPTENFYTFDDATANKLRMLLGPHSKTIIKVHDIRSKND